jgi:membrane protease YdiL (CAAX protease family)
VLFAAAHAEGRQFLGLALFGVVLFVLRRSTGRLAMGMVSHAAFNAVALSGILLHGHR